jgi:predicted nuclease of predicted toxin-antitoxin system
MRVLLDTCIWGPTQEPLRAAGHDVEWAGDWLEDPGDEEILRVAFEQRRVLVTLDKDFGELVIVGGRPHAGILRLVNVTARQQAEVCLAALAAHGPELEAGAIVTASPGRLRIRGAGDDT